MITALGGSCDDAMVRLRVFFIPFFANSHIIPMFHLARRMAASRPGVETTMVLTPANADVIRPVLRTSTTVRLLLYPFPSSEVNLPEGIENLSSARGPSELSKVEEAVIHARAAHERILRDHHPDAVVSDFHYWWNIHTAGDLGIPCVTFGVIGAFSQASILALKEHGTHLSADENPFVVPGLPGPPIELVRSELPASLRPTQGGDQRDEPTQGGDQRDEAASANLIKAMESQSERFGMLVNTFYELEPEYCDHVRRTSPGGDMWFVGPAFDIGAEVEGNDGRLRDRCLTWLDAQKPESVVFVCLGSWAHLSPEQLREMAAGLESSGHPFLWVVRESLTSSEWMPEEGLKPERGMVVSGWAPQVAILSHPAVGAFLTHCGWNSVLEAAATGVPMLTWPLAVDQFINERLVVGVMGAGARAWDGFRSTDVGERVVVPREAIGMVVSRFMEAGGAGEEARRRAREYAALARAAVAEDGSSRRDMNRLVNELMELTDKRTAGGASDDFSVRPKLML